MDVVAFLRGVTPNGKNRISKMAYLVEILLQAGFENVRTHIQSGNIVLKIHHSIKESEALIHDIILDKIGADLSVIIKTASQLKKAVLECPIDLFETHSRIHLCFTNDSFCEDDLNAIDQIELLGEIFCRGTACFYLYLPRDADKKRLNNNLIERKLKIVATSRKLNVVEHLIDMLNQAM